MSGQNSPGAATPEGRRRLRPGRFDTRREVLRGLRRVLLRLATSEALPAGETMLDYGCGSRPYWPLFEPRFRRLVGADLAANAGADLHVGADGRLPLPEATVDAVLSSQVLEHVRSPPAYLAEAHRVLRPGGRLLLSTHGTWPYHPDPEDFWRWTEAGLCLEIERAGFRVLEVAGVLHLPSVAIQLFQDACLPVLPGPVRPAGAWVMQGMIAVIERLLAGRPAVDAAVHVVVAEKATAAPGHYPGKKPVDHRARGPLEDA